MKIRLCAALAAIGVMGSAAGQLSRLDYTPHLLQEGFGPHGEYLPNDGAEYCVPTSFTMAMYWLRANGLTRIAPKLTAQNALDTDLAIAGFYGTTPDGGTESSGVVNVTPNIETYLALRGISGVSARKFEKPDYARIQEAVSGSNIGVINIAWVNPVTQERKNGHDVTVVATGIDALGQPTPTNVVINNPMARETQFVPTQTLYDFGPFTGYLAFLPGYLSKTGVIPVIEGVTILTPVSFDQPLASYRPASNLSLAATGGSMSILAPIVGGKGLTKSGASTVVFDPSSRSTYRGRTRILGGSVVTRLASGPALARGDIQFLAGSLVVAPRGHGRATPVLGVKGRKFSFTGGTLELRRGLRSSLEVSIAGSFLRGVSGTLVIAPSRGLGELDGTESLILDGSVSGGLVDGQGNVAPAVLGQDSDGSGDFLRYDRTRGFLRAEIGGIETDQEVASGETVSRQSLRIDDASLHGSGTLRLSGAISGLILNGGAVETSRLIFDGEENVLFAGRAGGRIAARIEGAGGLIVTGLGAVRLSAGNDYSGPTVLNGATLIAANTEGSATGKGPVTVRPGATLKGSGKIAGDVRVEGTLQAGEQAGKLRVDGNVSFGPQAVLDWELADLNDNSAGAGTHWGLLETGGDITCNGSGNQFQILQLHFPPGKSPNRSTAFWQRAHRWLIARAGGTLNVSGLSIQDPRFTAGQFAISAAARDLALVYTPAAL